LRKKSENQTDVFCVYLKAKDFRTFYVNGAYGGLSPKGEVTLNFYFEKFPLPKRTGIKLSPEGKVLAQQHELPLPEEYWTEREVQTSVVLNIEEARNFADWLTRIVGSVDDKGKKSEKSE